MSRQSPLVLSLLAATAPAFADLGCQTLQAEIEAKIRTAGVSSFSLVTVDKLADIPGKVVGSCGQGSKKIVYAAGGPTRPAPASSAPAPASAPARAGKVVSTVRPEAILTECKDGSVSVGGECKP